MKLLRKFFPFLFRSKKQNGAPQVKKDHRIIYFCSCKQPREVGKVKAFSRDEAAKNGKQLLPVKCPHCGDKVDYWNAVPI